MTTVARTTTLRRQATLRNLAELLRDQVATVPAVVWAVLVSRVLTLAGGWLGAALVPRAAGWNVIDPARVTTSFGSVGNLLAGPFIRWDAVAYLGIAQHGYHDARLTAFFPLFPLLIHLVAGVTGSDALAGVLINFVAFGVALRLLHALTEFEMGRSAADASVLLLAFWPVSLLLTAVYTEALFLALVLGAVYAARKERWLAAGILAALASICRVRGILVAVLIAGLYVQRHRRLDRSLRPLLLAPIMLAGFVAYLAARGYGWFTTLHQQVGSHAANRLTEPLATIWAAAHSAWGGILSTAGGVRPFSPSIAGPFAPPFESLLLFAVLLLSAAMLVLVFRRLPLMYGIYSLVELLICLSAENKFQPLQGYDRYLMVVFPLWMAAGAWVAERRLLRALVPIGAGVLLFNSFLFGSWAHFA